MATGGDIVELTSSNPDLGTFVYAVKVTEENTYDTGNFRANDDANMKTGAGEAIWQLNNKMGFVQITLTNDMNKKSVERLALEAGNLNDTTYTFQVVNGKKYRGTGRPVGDINPNINNSSVSVKIAAPEFKQI